MKVVGTHKCQQVYNRQCPNCGHSQTTMRVIQEKVDHPCFGCGKVYLRDFVVKNKRPVTLTVYRTDLL